jgi:hypothetical protein
LELNEPPGRPLEKFRALEPPEKFLKLEELPEKLLPGDEVRPPRLEDEKLRMLGEEPRENELPPIPRDIDGPCEKEEPPREKEPPPPWENDRPPPP